MRSFLTATVCFPKPHSSYQKLADIFVTTGSQVRTQTLRNEQQITVSFKAEETNTNINLRSYFYLSEQETEVYVLSKSIKIGGYIKIEIIYLFIYLLPYLFASLHIRPLLGFVVFISVSVGPIYYMRNLRKNNHQIKELIFTYVIRN